MPRKESNTGPISAQAQQDLVSEGIENFELPKSLVTKIAKSAVRTLVILVPQFLITTIAPADTRKWQVAEGNRLVARKGIHCFHQLSRFVLLSSREPSLVLIPFLAAMSVLHFTSGLPG
jgi:hypothetical protein